MFKDIEVKITIEEGWSVFTASLNNFHHTQVRLKMPYNLEEFEAASNLFINRAKELTKKVNANA